MSLYRALFVAELAARTCARRLAARMRRRARNTFLVFVPATGRHTRRRISALEVSC